MICFYSFVLKGALCISCNLERSRICSSASAFAHGLADAAAARSVAAFSFSSMISNVRRQPPFEHKCSLSRIPPCGLHSSWLLRRSAMTGRSLPYSVTRYRSKNLILASLTKNGDEFWEEDHDEEMDDERKVVILRDVAMDRVIECFVDREIEIEGRKYATLMPADTPVILAQV